MAILPTLPGITVTVISTTLESAIPVPLTEFSEDQDPIDVPAHIRHKSTTNFIQCIPGAPFSFKLEVAPPYKHDCPTLGFGFRLNGVGEGDFQLCHRENMDPEEGGDMVWEEEVKGLELLEVGEDGVERMVLRGFQFAELKTNDNRLSHRTAAEKEAVKTLGLVEVLIYRLRRTKFIKPKKKKLSMPVTEVPEKLVKGLAMSLSVELGNAEEAEEDTVFQATSLIDGEDHPVGVFRFKYRSKKDLQHSFIIPRSPSPEPSPSPPPPTFSSLDALEIAELAKVAHQKSELCQRSIARLQKKAFVNRPFEDLDDEERGELAKVEWESIVGMANVKTEKGKGGPRKRKRGRGRREERMREDGRLEISLLGDDESIQAIAGPETGDVGGEASNAIMVPGDVSVREVLERSLQERGAAEEDEVEFVSARPVKKTRGEREAMAERERVKEENA